MEGPLSSYESFYEPCNILSESANDLRRKIDTINFLSDDIDLGDACNKFMQETLVSIDYELSTAHRIADTILKYLQV